MFNVARVLHALELPPERFQVLCLLLWDDAEQPHAEEISPERVAVLGCGLLLYRYTGPEQAVWIMQQVQPLLNLEQPTVISIVNQRFTVFDDYCWDLVTGQRYTHDESPLKTVIESHALDVRAFVDGLAESQERPTVGEALQRLLRARQAADPDEPLAPASDEPSASDRPTED